MKTLKLGVLAASIAIASGCSNTKHHPETGWLDVKTTPPVHLLEVDQIPANIDYKLSDQKVYKFAYLLEDTMRKRVSHGRKWEEGLSGLQIIFAAFAAAASGSMGVHPDVVTTLSGLSALTPEIANIINAGEKARAYAQGLELVEQANAEYIRARASAVSASDKIVPDDQLTAEGAALFVSVMATLKVMRDALLQTIPKEEDLAKASGKYSLFALNVSNLDIDVSTGPAGMFTAGAAVPAMPFVLNTAGESYYTRTITTVKGGTLVSCVADAPNIVSVDNCSGSNFNVIPKQQGTANITVINDAGYRAKVTVNVK